MIVVLPTMRANERDELQLDLYMPSTESADEGGPGYRVRELWVQRLCI